MGKRRRTRREAAAATASAIPMPEVDFHRDPKLALSLRPSAIIKIGGEQRSSVRSEAIEVRRYADATLYDRMHARGQLSDAQHAAAAKLGRLWQAGGLNQRITGRYGASKGVTLTDDGISPRDAYRAIMRDLPAGQAMVVEDMLVGIHPGISRLDMLYGALDDLAKTWGLDCDDEFGFDD